MAEDNTTMDKRIRLWIECDDLKPDGLAAILTETHDDEDDVLRKTAQCLQDRFAQRIANAVGEVLQADSDVDWENTTFDIAVTFHATSLKGLLTPTEATDAKN